MDLKQYHITNHPKNHYHDSTTNSKKQHVQSRKGFFGK
jgi:hypothetical protein